MTFSIHGIPAAKGIAIGRAVRVVSSRASVAHYFIEPEQVPREIARVRQARNAVQADLERVQSNLLSHSHKDAPQELSAIMDVHLMLLQDETLSQGVKHWIEERHYNAEWALTTQLELIAAQFDEMQDPYMRERKADLEQVVEHLLAQLQGQSSTHLHAPKVTGDPLVMVAHDLSPAAMLQFKGSVFTGFVTDVGGKTSHTAIVARSMGIPAVVGAKSASQLIRQDDWVIVDGEQGILIVDPSPTILAQYRAKQQQWQASLQILQQWLHTNLHNAQGEPLVFWANIEEPSDAQAALQAGAQGVGLFRTEFLFMGRAPHDFPSEEEQYQAYRSVLQVFADKPVTIRTIDIGADKPLDGVAGMGSKGSAGTDAAHVNPALGLRAIRWCLAEPAMFMTQLRALLRAAKHGDLRILIPMLAHESEIKQCMLLIDRVRVQLEAEGLPYGHVQVGAMIEVPAAALIVATFLRYFDFLSIGTNDLIQYTLAIDRADETVAHLYDPWHPAVHSLMAGTIASARQAGKSVSVCGEMAGDPAFTQALLTMGLTHFSMHPSQILNVKQASQTPAPTQSPQAASALRQPHAESTP